MKARLVAFLLLAGGSLFAETHFSIGIGLGTPYYAPPPPPPAVYMTPSYTWVPGYWYPAGPRYSWHAGYWAHPPYAGAYWVAPRYYGQHFYPGYWGRGRHWDDDDDHWEHHDRGWHRGWYRHHDDD